MTRITTVKTPLVIQAEDTTKVDFRELCETEGRKQGKMLQILIDIFKESSYARKEK